MAAAPRFFWYSTDTQTGEITQPIQALYEIRTSWSTQLNTTRLVGPAGYPMQGFMQSTSTIILSTSLYATRKGSLDLNYKYASSDGTFTLLVESYPGDIPPSSGERVAMRTLLPHSQNAWKMTTIPIEAANTYNLFLFRTRPFLVQPENLFLYYTQSEKELFVIKNILTYEGVSSVGGNIGKGLVILPDLLPGQFGSGPRAMIPTVTVDPYGRVTLINEDILVLPPPFQLQGDSRLTLQGVGSSNQTTDLIVTGALHAATLEGIGSNLTQLSASNLVGNLPVPVIAPLTLHGGSRVGIGTPVPRSMLHVAGGDVRMDQALLVQGEAWFGSNAMVASNLSARHLAVTSNLTVHGNTTLYGTVSVSNLSVLGSFQATNSNVVQSTQHVISNLDTSVALRVLKHGTRFDLAEFVNVTTNTTCLKINAMGCVGIGTTRPGAMLHVAGSLRATTLEGDGSGLTNLNIQELRGRLPPSQLPALFTLTGNMVGVGSTQPTSTLDVGGIVRAQQFQGDGSLLQSLPAVQILGTLPPSALPFPFFLRPTGAGCNVGIGSTRPYATLDVQGSLMASNITAREGGRFSGHGGGLTHLPAEQLQGTLPDASMPSFFTLSNARVGMGVTLPKTTLAVGGNLCVGWMTAPATGAAPLHGALIQGNVGIGTLSVKAPLTVAGTILADYGGARGLTAGRLVGEPTFLAGYTEDTTPPTNPSPLPIQMIGGTGAISASNVYPVMSWLDGSHELFQVSFSAGNHAWGYSNFTPKLSTTLRIPPVSFLRFQVPVPTSGHQVLFVRAPIANQRIEAWVCQPSTGTPIARLQARFQDEHTLHPFHGSPWNRSKIEYDLLEWMAFSLPVSVIPGLLSANNQLTIAVTGFDGGNPILWLSAVAVCANPYGIATVTAKELIYQANGGHSLPIHTTPVPVSTGGAGAGALEFTVVLAPRAAYSVRIPCIATQQDIYVHLHAPAFETSESLLRNIVLSFPQVTQNQIHQRAFAFCQETKGRIGTHASSDIFGTVIPGEVLAQVPREDGCITVTLKNRHPSAFCRIAGLSTECVQMQVPAP